MRETRFIFLLILLSTISYSQYKSDFMIADSSLKPFFDFDNDGYLHMVWCNAQTRDKSVRYSSFDSAGNIVYQTRRISSTIAASDPKLAINKKMIACVWEDRVALNFTIFSTYIVGKILKDGLDYSNELHIDDGDTTFIDAYRRAPEIIWHNDSILYPVWFGHGSRSFRPGYTDIYFHKIFFPPLRKAYLIDTVLNNSWIKISEMAPIVIRKSTGLGYLALWVEKDSTNLIKIVGFTCNDSLNPILPKIVYVNFDSTIKYISKPAVFHRANGNIIIAWERDTANYKANIYFQEFTEQGISVGGVKKVNEKFASDASEVSASTDSDDNFIIAWEDGSNLMAQRYSADMNKIGTNFQLNRLQTGDNIFPSLRLRNRKIYTTWSKFVAGSPSVWMNILDFDNPTVVVTDENLVVKDYALEQNYPNPFNPTTRISYSLPKAGNVVLKVYDILGKEVTTLVNGYNNEGQYIVEFDASKLSSGIYIYKLTSGNFTSVKKMQLVK